MYRKASESGYTATGATILIDFYDIYDEIICQIIPFFLLKSLNLYFQFPLFYENFWTESTGYRTLNELFEHCTHMVAS